jgi:hypothetical protein
MMFGAGVVVLLIRKGGDWSEWARFVAFLIPALIMFGVVLVGRTREVLSGWHVAFLVFGTLLLAAALVELVDAIDNQADPRLNIAWIFGLCAALAIASSLALRAQFQMLLGGLLAIVAWLAFWDKALSNPSGETVRWLLIVLAAIFLAGGVALTRARIPQASDLITVAGIAAVIAAALSFAAAAGAFSPAVGSLSSSAPKPGQGWNVFLLVVSLLLIAYESRSPTRGPGYVGALGLVVFIALTGVDLVNRINGDDSGGVAGWPLILLIVGGAALVASFVMPGGAGRGGAGAPAAPGGPGLGAYAPPGATQPGAPAVGQPGLTQPGAPQPGAPQPGGVQPGGYDQPTAPRQVLPEPGQPLPPPTPGQPGQQGTPLDQWRQQPPPGGEPPPQQ